MHKLQEVLFNTISKKTTPATCLMIVLLSSFLFYLPNQPLSEDKEVLEHQQQHGARRALLFNMKGK